jgi:hypothetical protein
VRPERLARACVIAALVMSGCGGSDDPGPVATEAATEVPTAMPTTDAVTPPPDTGGDGSSPAINSIAVDPADGTIVVGTGPALYRLAPGAKEAEKLVGTLEGGSVSGSLVVRFRGPKDLLASGHPQDGDLPENLGLIRSSDDGQTWERVPGPEGDYHELEIAGKQIIGVNAESPDIQVSGDGGATWEARTPPAPPIDVVVNPGDAQQWAVSTEQGTFISSNAGQSWRPRDTSFGARLAWPTKDALFSVDRNGKVRVSPDGGRRWEDRGDIGGLPSEIAVGRQDEVLAGVVGGKIRRTKDGGRTWSTVTTLR